MRSGVDEETPSPPEKPLSTDCCGSGCSPCVFDVYSETLAEWRRQLDNPAPAKPVSDVLSRLRYSPFKLTRIVSQTRDASVYTFQATREGAEVVGELNCDPGQHLIVKAVVDGAKISRAFTPIATRLGQFDLVVKLYEFGLMSGHFAKMAVGDVEYFRGPYGGFRHAPKKYRKVVMACAGTGLAPMFAVAKSIVDDGEDETEVEMLYSVKKVEEILLRDELIVLTGFWNFALRIFVTDGGLEGKRYLENVSLGRITEEDVRKAASDDGLVLICGTEGFNADMLRYVEANSRCDSFVF